MKVYKTSIFPDKNIQGVEHSQAYMPSWFLIAVLVVAFYILKSFIYNPDEKRKGK